MKRDLQLYESRNTGKIELCALDQGPAWTKLPPERLEAAVGRERIFWQHKYDHIGSFQGRKVVIFGCGPMLKRITSEQILWMKAQNYVLIGVNAMPKYCRLHWDLDPSDIFDFVLAADTVRNVWDTLWEWDKLTDKTVKMRKMSKYKTGQWPFTSHHECSLIMDVLFYADSITACINLALLGLATDWLDEKIGGPYRDWPVKQMQKARGGEILLVGVEHNNYNHAYSDDERFPLCDHPEKPWPNMEPHLLAHKKLSSFSKELEADIYNAAEWSKVQAHVSVDFETFLGMPKEIHTGVTALGQPDPDKIKRAMTNYDARDIQDKIDRGEPVEIPA